MKRWPFAGSISRCGPGVVAGYRGFPEAIFDAEFALMTGELALLAPRLLDVFGGEA